MTCPALLPFLDKFFLFFHLLFTIFNCTGWMFRRTRKIHLAAMGATALSWFVLGIWYGWGYCFCTDWHWRVREALGRPIETPSYIHFLIREFSCFDPDPVIVDYSVLAVFAALIIVSALLNIRDRRGR